MGTLPNQLSLLLNGRLHLMVAVISVLSEWVGVQSIPFANAKLLFLPLFYAFALCLFLNPNITKFSRKIITKKNASIAAPLIVIGILPFIAKFGTLIGPALPKIAEAGSAMIFQELGNLGTMLIAMPIAVLVFKMGRESIGATFSIAREPNIALISDRYGLKSNEGIGVMGVYVMGTMFGTVYFSLLAGFLATTQWFDPRALAMACGVGSGSMTAACSGTLVSTFPAMKDELLAFAGASNLLTNATGLYIAIFITLPFSEWFYKKLSNGKVDTMTKKSSNNMGAGTDNTLENQEEIKLTFKENLIALVVLSIVSLVSNWAGTGNNPLETLPAILIIYIMVATGLLLAKWISIRFPAVAWVSLVSVLLTIPVSPVSGPILAELKNISFLAMVTPILAYAAIAITKAEVNLFKRAGFKIAIISILVFTGTYLGSALVANAIINY